MRRLTVLLTGMLLVLPVNLPRAEASPSSIVIVGHGWGHGRGMGQWGARGMAVSGASWRSIVHHFYSGVRITGSKATTLRVLLERRTAFVIGSKDPIRASANGHVIARSTDERHYLRVRYGSTRTHVDRGRTASGPWTAVARTSARTVSFTPTGTPIQVRRSMGPRWYRGVIQAVRSGGKFMVIDRVNMEQYLRGVVPREMPASWPGEALKAQAVAARSYALRVAQVARARSRPYDICATPACQVYGGYARWHNGRREVIEHPRTNAAVRATAGRILTYRGAPILSEYSSSTGGWTMYGGFPYLKPVPDRYDSRSPLHSWRVRVPAAAIEASWPSIGDFQSISVLSRTASYARGGRVKTLAVRGSRGTIRVSGNSFRSMLGLRSRWFAVSGSSSSSRYVFTFNMGYGTRHPAVAELQRRLRAGGYFPRTQDITTYFGPITRESVRRYQRAHGISQTAFLGPKTRASLNR